jgi:colanic acid/amylovoran biosynthesis glycosyltransferase
LQDKALLSSPIGQTHRASTDVAADVTAPWRSAEDRFGGSIGYLTNVYPSVSHSFIRREILALEKHGIAVARFSVRRSVEPLPDPEDQRERSRTTVLLDAGTTAMIAATVRLAVTRPWRFVRALGAMQMMRRAAGGGRLRHLAYLTEAALLVRMMEQRAVRHLHVHFGTNPAAVAALCKVLGAISYSITVHGPEEFDAPIALSLPHKIAEATFVAAISSHGLGQLMRWSDRRDWNKLAIVRCGLDRRFLDHEACPPSATSAVLVCIARLDRQKGLSLLLDAVALVAPTLDVTVRIIGDGPMREELLTQIAKLGLAGRVRLLGWKSAAAIREELTAARALVLPSFAEGLPVVLMEALALHRPVIATWIAGVPELVDASCGWLVPPGSAHALAAAMSSALGASQASLVARGAAGHAIVRDRHDAMTNAAQLATLFSAVCHGRPIELAGVS